MAASVHEPRTGRMLVQDRKLGRNAQNDPARAVANHPYFLVYTNTPGEIVYEDKYQIAAKVDGFLQIEELQPSWAPEQN